MTTTDVRADFFWVATDNATPVRVENVVKSVAQEEPAPTFEIATDSGRFQLTNLEWHVQERYLSGVIWRIREDNLPCVVDGDLSSPPADLPIGEDAGLAEPMCFVLKPRLRVVVAAYNHTGARHTRIGSFLEKMGVAGPVLLSPMVTGEAEERLSRASVIRSAEFGLALSPQMSAALVQNGSTASAISIGRGLGAIRVKVQVSMGHVRNSSLNLEAVKDVATRLLYAGDVVTSLTVRAAEHEDEKAMPLNLLNDRVFAELRVNQVNRRIDVADCVQKLYSALESRSSEIRQRALAREDDPSTTS